MDRDRWRTIGTDANLYRRVPRVTLIAAIGNRQYRSIRCKFRTPAMVTPPHIAGHSHRKDLQDLQHLPRSPVLSYMQKQAVPRAPRVKTASRAPARHPILAAFTPKGRNWIWEYLLHRVGPRHPFQLYPSGSTDQGVYKLVGDDREIRIALAGDWATGTDEAESVSKLIVSFKPHYSIHLGDVYT